MNQITNPAGLRVLESLVDFVNNKKEIEKVLTTIHAARDEANERIAVVGKIGDIDRLNGQAATLRQEAQSALGDAKREAESILRKAGVKAMGEKEKQRQAAEILKAADAREKKLDARETSVTAREKELQEHMDQTAVSHKEATELKGVAEELIAKANEQLALFKSVASQLN